MNVKNKIHTKNIIDLEFFKSLRTHDWNNLSKIDIVLTCIALLLCFFTMYYADITVTSQFGLTFLDSIFDGKILSFYQNCLNTGIAPEGAVYDMGTYIVFGIWAIPVWIINKIVSIKLVGAGVQLWFKLMITLFMLISIKPLASIARSLEINEASIPYVNLIYLLSCTLWMPVLVASQYDIIPLLFVLLGFDAYLKDEKRYIAFFATAITMKPFAILLYFALVLLAEKNILKILRNLVLVLIPVFIFKFAYSFTPGYSASSGSFLDNNLDHLLGTQIDLGLGKSSLFIVALVGIYIWSYLNDKENKKSTWMACALWTTFVVLAESSCYWSVYLAPFIVLTMFLINNDINKCLIINIVFELSLTIAYILNYSWVYGGEKTFSYLVIKGLYNKYIPTEGAVTIAGILRKLSVDRFFPAITAIIFATILTILVLGYKSLCIEDKNGKNIDRDSNDSINIWVIRFKYIIVFGWFLVCLGAFLLGTMGY